MSESQGFKSSDEVESHPATVMWHPERDAHVTGIMNEDMRAQIQMMKDQEKELWRRMDEKLMEGQSEGLEETVKESKDLKEEVQALKEIIEAKNHEIDSLKKHLCRSKNGADLKMDRLMEAFAKKTTGMKATMMDMGEKIFKDEMQKRETEKTMKELMEEVKSLEEEQAMVKWKFVVLFFFFIFTNVVSFFNGIRYKNA